LLIRLINDMIIIGCDNMLKTENIDFAIFETLRVHPDFFPTMTATLLNQIKNGIELKSVTTA